jgi:hypothetical protein
MYEAFVLVRNFESRGESLDFGQFTIGRVARRFNELQRVFSSTDVAPDDWVFEKSYATVSAGITASPVEIPDDVEDILLLLRLYKPGEVSFIRLAVILPGGNSYLHVPYRAMNDLNSYSIPKFIFEPEEIQAWSIFAESIRSSESWRADWFVTARRFFLGGGAKPFKVERDEVDRIVDYATALESTLVPEKDYNTQRITRRAAALISPDSSGETADIVRFLKKFYDIRSHIVHGRRLDDKSREWLAENCDKVEVTVRRILVAAVQRFPPGESDRKIALAELYDPTDEDRGMLAFEKFRQIGTPEVSKAIAARIAQLEDKSSL